MKKNYKVEKDYHSSWYALTPNRLLMTLGALTGEVNCDICVIGGGFTGLSAALELAQKGFSVTLLEAETIAGSASGKNGGHVQRGFSKSPGWLTAKYGADTARMMCNLSLEGIGLMLERIQQHGIDCDIKFGHLTAAMKPRHCRDLKDEIEEWAKVGHTDLQYLGKSETQALVRNEKYIAGLFDPKAGHFHPLNYALGIAAACQKLGVKLHDESRVNRIETGSAPKAFTDKGVVNAKYIIVAGAIDLPQMNAPMRTSISAQAHMIATEPLGEKRARDLITRDIAVIDANFVMNYYRFSSDHRLLFGGNCNYSGKDFGSENDELRLRMLSVFPSLRMTRIDHCWHGPLDLTANRMPHLGRISPTVYFAHGFGGHGVVATNILGKVIAEAVAGTAERFDVFTKIGHTPIFGGGIMKRPLFVLGMMWYKMRDLL